MTALNLGNVKQPNVGQLDNFCRSFSLQLYRKMMMRNNSYLTVYLTEGFLTGYLRLRTRAQPDWAYEFLDRTGPDSQICRTGPAGPD